MALDRSVNYSPARVVVALTLCLASLAACNEAGSGDAGVGSILQGP